VELRICEECLRVFPGIFGKFPRNTLFRSLLPLEAHAEYNFNSEYYGNFYISKILS
jgi:hypothetical protein